MTHQIAKERNWRYNIENFIWKRAKGFRVCNNGEWDLPTRAQLEIGLEIYVDPNN